MVDGGLQWDVQYTAVTTEKYETRDMKDKSKKGGPVPQSTCSFKFFLKEKKYYHAWKGYFNR